MADKCKECGCICKQCNKNEEKHNDMHLHVEIESLRQRLVERDNHIVTMETQFLSEAEKFPNGEVASLKEEMFIWQDKYARLYEAHKRVQKVNQNLEDKLLRIVDKCETEKGAFTKDIATLSHRLAEANYTIHRLTQDNEKYRNDVNLAIQLLQNKPSNFVGQKYELLPPEVQAKVRSYVAQKGRINEMPSTEVKSITVPISTFPPTAMVYNVAKPTIVDKQDDDSDDDLKPPVDIVSTAIMAKILEDREKEKIYARHCNTCTCHRSVLKIDSETQTEQEENKFNNTRDYFNKRDHSSGFKNKKIGTEVSQLEGREMTLNSKKGHTRSNDFNVRHASFHCTNEALETKHINGETSKIFNRHNLNAKNYLNMKNSSKLKSKTNEVNLREKEESKSTNDECRIDMQGYLNDCKISVSDKKLPKETKNFDEQAKIDMINERLWKSSWQNSKTVPNTKESQQLDVINERIWRNNSNNNSNNKKSTEQPARLTVIEVRSADDLTNESEKSVKTEPSSATSPSYSGDSMLISSSDPSSLSSDSICKKERTNNNPGPRNCLMRMTPGSNNILLDNQTTPYQTVLYTSGSSRPSTALVHLAKSSRSGRSASISSEENASSCSLQNDTALQQRVAQWVDTLDSTSPSPSQDPLLPKVNQSESTKLPANKQQLLPQTDLITFEGSSDEEFRLASPADLTNQMEETYLKLAASLDTTSLRSTQDSPDFDIMTIEKYRKQQKRSSFKSSLTNKNSNI